MSAHNWRIDAPVRMLHYGTIAAIANVLELTVWQLTILNNNSVKFVHSDCIFLLKYTSNIQHVHYLSYKWYTPGKVNTNKSQVTCINDNQLS